MKPSEFVCITVEEPPCPDGLRDSATKQIPNPDSLIVPGVPSPSFGFGLPTTFSERFDLLGNSLAILSGLASPTRSRNLVSWIESECVSLRQKGDLALDLPPCFFPYTRPEDPDWRPRYAEYNRPGEYHNGGVWPFVCGFYVAALAAAGRRRLAKEKLLALTRLVQPAREARVAFGFNEWFRAQDGAPCGQDWQTWSAAMYLYAAASVERGEAPFFEEIRVKKS